MLAEQLEMQGGDGDIVGMGWGGDGCDTMRLPDPKHTHGQRSWVRRQPHPT